MTGQSIERASCRFLGKAAAKGTPVLQLEVFHPVSSLAGLTLELELLGGTTLDQARKLAESINERMIGIVVTGNEALEPLLRWRS